jgi:hypothetical protein
VDTVNDGGSTVVDAEMDKVMAGEMLSLAVTIDPVVVY